MADARFADAIRHFEQARGQEVNVAVIAAPWSRALTKVGRRAEACVLLEGAAAAEPEQGALRYLAGACHMDLDAPCQALPHLEAAQRKGVSHLASQTALAKAGFECGRPALAAGILTEIAEASTSPALLTEIGRQLFRNVLYRQALFPLRKAWDLSPGSYDIGMYLALAHHQLEEPEVSRQVLSAITSAARPAEYRILLASVLGALGEVDAARREFEGTAREYPARADAYLNFGLFLLDNGHGDEAVKVLGQSALKDFSSGKILYRPVQRTNCLGLAPPAATAGKHPDRAAFFVALGDSLLAGQQWVAALEVYLAALSISPRTARAYGGIGLVCQELGTAQVGLEFARRGTELDPDDPRLHYYLGSLHEYLSDPAEAIKHYRSALRLSSESSPVARYWLRLGMALVAAGSPSEAEKALQTALAKDPRSAEVHFQLGKLRLRDGRYAEAELLLGQAVRMDRSLAEAAYSWARALLRTGQVEAGRAILDAHQENSALRQSGGGGMR